MTLEDQHVPATGPVDFPHHTLPPAALASLTRGFGTAPAVRRLAGTERSWRLIAVHGLLRALAEGEIDTGPLAPAADAWRLLTEVGRVDRGIAEQALMYPQTGVWVAHLFRRLRNVVTDPTPLWCDIGYLHAVAAAAAIRAGLDCAIDIPVRHGLAVLPRLGSARFAGLDGVTARVTVRAGSAVLACGDRQVRVDAGDPGWRPAPVCGAESAGLRIEVVLDDVDPYRNLRGHSTAAPLSGNDVARWRALLRDAWTILVAQDRPGAESVAASLTAVNPLPAAEPYRPLSASCDEAFAAVVASMPDDAEQLAVTLVHETQHVRLGALLHLFRFVEDNSGPRLYAPWRDDPRPLAGLLQGIYAFVGITAFWRSRPHPAAAFEFALWRRQLRRVLTGLDAHPGLTPDGRGLVTRLAESVAEWDAQPVDREIRALAEAAATDHYGQWRCHHLPVPAGIVETVTQAWLAGAVCPPLPTASDPAPVVDRGVRWLDGRAVLARMRLRDPAAFDIARKAPADVGDRVPGALPGDVAFVVGDQTGARDSYAAHLAHHPGDPRGWLGLGLSRSALGTAPALLLDRPELVRAVARSVARHGGTFSASALIDWLTYC